MRLAQGSRGQALAEFALAIPIFVMLVFGLLDLGRVVFAANAVAQMARAGARQAIVSPAMTQAKYDSIRTTAQRFALLVTVPNSGIVGASSACPGANDTTTPGSCFYATGIASGSQVVVTVSGSVDLVTPVISQLVGGTFNVSSTITAYIQ